MISTLERVSTQPTQPSTTLPTFLDLFNSDHVQRQVTYWQSRGSIASYGVHTRTAADAANQVGPANEASELSPVVSR